MPNSFALCDRADVGARKRLRGLLTATSVLGAALLSVAAHAATIEPLSPALDPNANRISIGVIVSGNSPTGFVQFYGSVPNSPFQGEMGRVNVRADGTAYVSSAPGQPLTVTAVYSGDSSNPGASVTFTVVTPTLDWIPTVLESLR